MQRPSGSNADAWALFLEEWLRPTEYVAVQIAEAIEAEREACAEIALSIDSGRGNEKEIAAAIRARA